MIKRTVLSSLLIASFVMATLACAHARKGEFSNSRPDRTWARTVGGIFTSGKSIAVVIAISNYIGARAGGYDALATAKHDADKMVDFLLNDAGFDTVHLLTDEDATKSNIEKLMTDVIPNVVTQRDRFLFYWSGHGEQRVSGDGRAFGFLPLADSKSKEFSSMVSMQDLERWDRYLDARQALFVLDACLSGLAGSQTKAPLNARLEQLSLPARHLITAGTKDEIVISGDRWGGSLFTDSFILGAKGQARNSAGIVSLPLLLDFIQDRVANERQAAGWSKTLTPQLQSLQYGEGFFFFTPVLPVGLPPSAALERKSARLPNTADFFKPEKSVAIAKLRAGEIAEGIAGSQRDESFPETARDDIFETGLLLQAGLRALLPIREREGVSLPGPPSPRDPKELTEAQENYKAVFASGAEATPTQKAIAVRSIELAVRRLEKAGYISLAGQVTEWLRTQ